MRALLLLLMMRGVCRQPAWSQKVPLGVLLQAVLVTASVRWLLLLQEQPLPLALRLQQEQLVRRVLLGHLLGLLRRQQRWRRLRQQQLRGHACLLLLVLRLQRLVVLLVLPVRGEPVPSAALSCDPRASLRQDTEQPNPAEKTHMHRCLSLPFAAANLSQAVFLPHNTPNSR